MTETSHTMLIAVDPGKTCGMFVVIVNDDGMKVFDHWEDSAINTVYEVERLLTVYKTLNVKVVVERYVLESLKQTRQYDAIEVIGALRWLSNKHGAMFELQGRAERLRVTNEMLRDRGWWTTSPGGHVNEAARHAVVAIVRYWPDMIAQEVANQAKE